MDFPHGDKLRFLIAGSTTTLATYLLYWGLLLLLDPRVAYPIACVAGIGMSYSLSSLWVFKRAWTRTGLFVFLVGYGVQTAVAYGLFLLLLAYTPVAPWLAPVLVTILLLPLTFLMNREMVHRTSPAPEAKP
jgi:putative flippase GtrA